MSNFVIEFERKLLIIRIFLQEYYLHFKNTGVPPDISLVFGNIESIYEETENLYSKLLECDSVEDIAIVFIDNVTTYFHLHLLFSFTNFITGSHIRSLYGLSQEQIYIILLRQYEI